MEQAPKSTVRIWMTKSRLQPTKLLPALIRYGQSRRLGMGRMEREGEGENDSEQQIDWAMRYLEFCVNEGNSDPSIHNYLLSR